MFNYLYLGMPATESPRQLFLYLYQQLQKDRFIKKRIDKMLSYGEKRLASLPTKMEEKLLVMKESDVIAIIPFMHQLLSQKLILDFDLMLFNE